MNPETLDYLRIAVNIFAIIVFTVGIIFPIKNTIIPYWKQFGKPSAAIFSRLFIRIALLALVIYNITFPILRAAGHADDTLWFRSLALPIYFVLAILYLHMWWMHPDKLNGL